MVKRDHLVSHDWGAAVEGARPAVAPERVDHLAALSVGHPYRFRTGGFDQYEKSWYTLLFQFAGIAEQWLSNHNWSKFRAWGRHRDGDAVIGELEATSSGVIGTGPTSRPSPIWNRPSSCPRSRLPPWRCGVAATWR